MMQDLDLINALEAQLPQLKADEAWDELEAIYGNLCRQALPLEQRLYYAWERAELLSGELKRPTPALEVLREAALWGGPLSVIGARMMSLSAELEGAERAEASRFTLNALEELELSAQRSAQELAELQAWRATLKAQLSSHQGELSASPLEPHPLTEAPFESISEGEIEAEEALSPPQALPQALPQTLPLTSAPALAPSPAPSPAQQDTSDAPLLEAQDTAMSPPPSMEPSAVSHTPLKALWARLSDIGEAERDPMAYLHALEELSELRPLTLEEQSTVEGALWHAAVQRGQWRLWVKLYMKVFMSPTQLASLPDEELARRAYMLGVVYQDELDEGALAVEQYREVLARYPNYHEVFERSRALLRQQKRWGDLIERTRAYLPHAQSAEARFELALEVGDLYREQLNSHPKAIEAWFEALELEPESRQVFVRLLEVYQSDEKWSSAVKVLKKLAQLEPEPEKKAHYLYTLGLLQRDQLSDHYLAVRSFDEALEMHPRFLKAFQAIEDTLDAQEQESPDPARRDRYARKMLLRAMEHGLDGALIAELGRQVGRLNHLSLAQPQEARRAYELTLSYEPADDEAHRGLIELARAEGAHGEAVKLAFQWVRRAPTHLEAYQELYRRALDAERLDTAWCTSAVLAALSAHVDGSERFFEEGKDYVGSRLTRPLTEREWRLLSWSGLDEAWGAVSAVSASALCAHLSIKPKLYQSHAKKQRLEVSAESTFGRVVTYLTSQLSLSAPPLWRGEGTQPASLGAVCFGELGLFVHPSIPEAQPIERLVTSLAYGLYLAQPERWLSLFGVGHEPLARRCERLEALAEATRGLLGQPGLSAEASELCEQLKRLPQAELSAFTQRLPVGELDRWLKGVEQSAYRVALLASGDLKQVIELMRSEPALSRDSFESRLYKLMLFAVSPPLMELRATLGLSYQR